MLVERDEQITELTSWATGPDRTQGRMALIGGPVASGKTSVLHRVLERTADSGVRVLSAVTSASERHIPFGVVEELLRDTQDAGGPLPLHGPTGAGDLVPVHTLVAFHARLAGLAARRPVLLAVDDVQYADPQSLHCLRYALGRARTAGVRLSLVVTHGPDAGAVPPPVLAELLGQVEALRLDLGPLSAPGIAGLLTDRAGGADHRAASLHAATGGNPLLVRSLLDDAGGQEDAEPGPFPAGEQFLQNALICIHRTGGHALRVAQAIALLGSAGRRQLLGRLVTVDEATVRQVVDALEATGILQGDRFRHDAVRTAVLETLTDDVVVHLRRRAARLLYEAGAAPVDVAAHLLGHGPGGLDEDWVPGVLSAAAHTALASQQVGFAVRCLRLAAECSRDERERLQLRASTAKFVWRLKPSAWLHELAPLQAALAQGTLPVSESLQLVGDLLWNGWIKDAAVAVRYALDAAPGSGESPSAAELRCVRLMLASTYPTLMDDAALRAAFAHAEPLSGGPADGLAGGLEALQGVLGSGAEPGAAAGRRDRAATDAQFIAQAEQILAGTRLDEETHVTVRACLLALLYAERLGAATAWTDRMLAEAAERGAPGWTAVMQAIRAHMALRRGELARARTLAEEALDHVPPHGWGVGIGLPLSALIEARTAMGDHEAAAALVDHPVPEQLLLTRYGLHYLYARARHRLATGRHHAALTDFTACGKRMRDWNMDREGLAPWRVGAAEAALALGNPGQAERLAREQLATGAGPRVRGLALRVLAGARPLPERPALLEQAVALLQREGDSHELARALTELGAAYEELGDAAQGKSCTRRAWRIAEACGARDLTRGLQADQVPPGEPAAPTEAVEPGPVQPSAPEAVSSLTDAERRVAALAAHGYTNREISAKLFITVSTVEQHLTRVYRKINITRRQDLPVSWDSVVAHTA
ncbi:LuxR family transcriptional regulator [Streptomyces sp. NRRL S-87]|uniref:helix-turn-helix transcriptional regulator n=1 Tax=Streptomyces sp. NRRL S-87 TaxID=1463920 RepID=UPI00099D3B25|nr:LuxR family transcriptional regulator [Streptomyces sp. NRRL S-87]